MKATIKHKHFSNASISKIKRAGIIFLTLLTAYSCRSSDVEGELTPGGQAKVSINIKDAVFERTIEINKKASANSSPITAPTVQKNTIAFADGFYLEAELSEEIRTENNPSSKASSQSNRAALDTAAVGSNIRYKIVAYDQSGLYVTEKDYTRGSEGTTGALMLDGGKTYSFIAYSVNSTNSLPAVTFANTANKTLTTSSVNIAGNADFMYYRKDMTLSGATTNNLDVVFRHKLSQITTTIDASQSGYNVTAVTSHFTQHNSTATINLANASIARTGTVGNSAVAFTQPNSLIATSTPTIINADANGTTSYTIDNLTVGPLSQGNITPFTNLIITPGVKYNMKLNIIPTDTTFTFNGLPAVRINGAIWMRHNVGVDTNLDPDQNPLTSALHGNYYQWGRIAIVAAPTANSTNGNWIRNNAGATFWNTGTEAAPIKTTADPCPTGFRIPTRTEAQKLLNDVVATNQGSFNAGSAQYGSAKILTSKRRRDVKLTFPAQGYFNVSGSEFNNYQPTGITDRGSRGQYHTSSASGTNIWRFGFINNTIDVLNLTGNASYRSQSRNIRCIAQ